MGTAEPNLQLREENEATNDSINIYPRRILEKINDSVCLMLNETSMCALAQINRNHNIPPVVCTFAKFL